MSELPEDLIEELGPYIPTTRDILLPLVHAHGRNRGLSIAQFSPHIEMLDTNEKNYRTVLANSKLLQNNVKYDINISGTEPPKIGRYMLNTMAGAKSKVGERFKYRIFLTIPHKRLDFFDKSDNHFITDFDTARAFAEQNHLDIREPPKLYYHLVGMVYDLGMTIVPFMVLGKWEYAENINSASFTPATEIPFVDERFIEKIMLFSLACVHPHTLRLSFQFNNDGFYDYTLTGVANDTHIVSTVARML